jgi:ABC-type lipoprotein release transport system permease subunit
VGVAVGSTLWQLTAEGAFVTTDPLILWWGIVGVTGAALAVGLGAALLPARHAAASAPAQLLRTE